MAVASGMAAWLAGGPAAFALARIDGCIVPAAQLDPAILTRLAAAPPNWAGLTSRPAIMGVLNLTPDSFSDGGRYPDAGAAVAAGLAMTEQGADIVDVGGESTRPGAVAVSPREECARVVPVTRALAAQGVVVSVDTRNASTMAAALAAGARIVNDVSALRHDPAAAPLLAASDCAVVLMHMRGDPASMTAHARYDDVALDVTRELAARVEAAEAAGIARARIAVDPGIGFAKTADHNLELLRRLGLLRNLGCPIVVGVSRKSFIGRLSGISAPDRRAPGSIAAGLHAVLSGAGVLRVHDVAQSAQAVKIWRGLLGFG